MGSLPSFAPDWVITTDKVVSSRSSLLQLLGMLWRQDPKAVAMRTILWRVSLGPVFPHKPMADSQLSKAC